MIQQKQTQVNQDQHGKYSHAKSSPAILDSHGFPCQSKSKGKTKAIDYNCTPFPEINWLIRALSADQTFF